MIMMGSIILAATRRATRREAASESSSGRLPGGREPSSRSASRGRSVVGTTSRRSESRKKLLAPPPPQAAAAVVKSRSSESRTSKPAPPELATTSSRATRGSTRPRPDPAERVFGEILRAQEGEDGRVPFRRALREIQNGKKISHWIWYVIPAMRAVRETSQPQFGLPSFEAARAYLKHSVLAPRLLQVTEVATAHLLAVPQSARPARLLALFGGIDSQKFRETMTYFALAALENYAEEEGGCSDTSATSEKQFAVFLEGLRGAIGEEGPLDPVTLRAIRAEKGEEAFEGLESVGDLLALRKAPPGEGQGPVTVVEDISSPPRAEEEAEEACPLPGAGPMEEEASRARELIHEARSST